MSYQIVIIQGNLGKDPEARVSKAGKNVCKFSVAVSDKSGGTEHTEWFNAVCFDKTADVAEKYLRKGSQVLLDGRLKTEEYEKDGEKKRFTSFLVSRLTLIGGGKGDSGGRDRNDEPATPPKSMATRPPKAADDDDLPF